MKCPGQDIRHWKSEAVFDVKCPNCRQKIEFFKDDTTRKCHNCGHKFINPKMDFGCASYCQYAAQCVVDFPEELKAQRETMLKDQIAVAMKRHFKKNFKRINRAMRLAYYAEQIGKNENGNLAVVLAAAYLYDIDKAAQVKISAKAKKTELPITKSILTNLRIKKELLDEVCYIIGQHNNAEYASNLNAKIVYDANLIVNLEEKQKVNPMNGEDLAWFIKKTFLTESGRKEASNIFEQWKIK